MTAAIGKLRPPHFAIGIMGLVCAMACIHWFAGSNSVHIVQRRLSPINSAVQVHLFTTTDITSRSINNLHETAPQAAPNETAKPVIHRDISPSRIPLAVTTQVSANNAADFDLAYYGVLQEHIRRHQTYPGQARSARIQGTVLIQFSLRRDGEILDVWIQKSSGNPILDEEAIETIERAQPMPEIPSTLPDQMDFTVPMSFSLT